MVYIYIYNIIYILYFINTIKISKGVVGKKGSMLVIHDKKVLTFNHNFILTTQFGLTLTTLTLFIVGFRTITSTHTKRARVMCD